MNKREQLIQSTAFKKLIKRKWIISICLTLLMLSAYFGFILTIAIDKTFFSQLIAEHITLAIPAGIGLIIFAWLMTGVYTLYANNLYDKEVEALKKELE
jgi:uncharacterized membrane protein (DUF485 family)